MGAKVGAHVLLGGLRIGHGFSGRELLLGDAEGDDGEHSTDHRSAKLRAKVARSHVAFSRHLAQEMAAVFVTLSAHSAASSGRSGA